MQMRFWRPAALMAAAFMTLSVPAVASAAAFSDFSDYSAVVFGDMTSSSSGDTEKSLAVGGNATFSGSYGFASLQGGGRLNVGGNMQFNANGQIGTGGNLGSGFVGGTYSGNNITAKNVVGSPNTTWGPLPGGNANFNFGGITGMGSVRDLLRDSSAAWSNLSGTTINSLSGGSLVFNKNAGSIFSINASLLNTANLISFQNFNSNDSILINVTGNANISNKGTNLNGASRSKIIYNFVDAASVQTTNFTFDGTVVAAYANVSGQNGNIEGQLFAQSYANRGSHEIHSSNYTGDLVLTPVPAALPLLASGLGALGFAYRRRKLAA